VDGHDGRVALECAEPIGSGNEFLRLDLAEELLKAARAKNCLDVNDATQQYRQSGPENSKSVGHFLASFLGRSTRIGHNEFPAAPECSVAARPEMHNRAQSPLGPTAIARAATMPGQR
jgi:hypothetical protein